MAQTPSLIATLKKQLKAHGKTYGDVATTLEISEASVKRLFSDQSFSLQRLESVCHMIHLQLSDLVLLMAKEQPQLQQLSETQEKDLVNDTLLLMLAINVINGHSFIELCQEINISDAECIRKLIQLDRLNIIELLPNNRIKLLIAANFRWRLNGPIQQFFQKHVEQDFFRSEFKKDEEKLLVLNGELSEHSNREMQKKLEALAKEFNQLMQEDSKLPKEQRQNITMVLASRAWQFALFDQFRRKI
jgi:DNA-binding Xre family transcriptional regulator